jgi:hypothetical protein
MSDAVAEQTTTAQVEDKIRAALDLIRDHFDELLDVPEGRSSGRPSTDTLTALERRLTLRQDVDTLLAGVCRLIIRDRPLTTVRLNRSAETGRMLTLIDRHAQWLSGHALADQIARRLTTWARNVELTARPPMRDHVLLGDCPFVIPDDAGVATWACYGRIQARIGGDGTAACTGCGQETLVEWWEDVLGLNHTPVTLPQLPPILHARLGLRVTDRTLRNWRRDGLIVALPEPGDPSRADEVGPRPQWDRFSPRDVIARAADIGRACVLCGAPWHGASEVCLACYTATAHAKPAHARPDDDVPRIAGVPVHMRPRVLQPPVIRNPEEPRPQWCDYGDLPAHSCACGNPLAIHQRSNPA